MRRNDDDDRTTPHLQDPGCSKPATRRGLCGGHYMKSYRASRAKREAAVARENAVCAARGWSRPLGKGSGRGLCHACLQKSWREEQRLGAVVKSKEEILADFWRLVREALPIEVAAHDAGLRLTDGLVAEILAEARRRRINFANYRYWYNVMVTHELGWELEPWEQVRYVQPKAGPEPPQYRVPVTT
jgi:hypothetical protein